MQLLLFSCFSIIHLTFAMNDCHINVKDGMHPVSPPLVINPSKPPQHIYPTTEQPSDLVFHHGEQFLIICPGEVNQNKSGIIMAGRIIAMNRSIDSSSALIECVEDNDFLIEGEIVSFADISCDETSPRKYSTILRQAPQTCDNGVRYEIGYELGDFGFLEMMQICHESIEARTLWAYSTIQPANLDTTRFSAEVRRSFKVGDLFKGIRMTTHNSPYNRQIVHHTLEQLLKGQADVNDYLSPYLRDRKYLARGHLIANSDKIFQREQDSTYFFANVVAMWQKINGLSGNWYSVEELVRFQANQLKRSLDVYAGGIGTLQISQKFIYLFKGNKIPVPKVLFKCMLDHQNEEGLCFLVANNPYINVDKVEDYVLCQRSNACDQFSENFEKAEVGFTYCCSLNNFYRATSEELGNELEPFRYYSEMRLYKPAKMQSSGGP